MLLVWRNRFTPAFLAASTMFFVPCTVTANGAPEARWLLCEYDETYVRADGAWLFETISMRVNFYAPHLAGWA